MIFLSVSFLLIITLNRHYDDFGAARSHLDKKNSTEFLFVDWTIQSLQVINLLER